MSKKGFTLIEILVVVVIIGLLTAVALPGYRKAVEKSKVADALTIMSAVAKSEHGWYLTNNSYTKDFANLDISLIDKDGNRAEDESFESKNYTFTLQDNFIKAERNNSEYFLYKLYEQDNIYCLPEEHYICQQYNWKGGVLSPMTAAKCQDIDGAWANTTSTCYTDIVERCKSLHGESAWNGEFCGYTNTKGQTIGEGEFCYGSQNINNPIRINGYLWNMPNAHSSACGASIVKDGGECIPTIDGTISTGLGPCSGIEVKDGGICRGITVRSCAMITISSGGICYGENDSCANTTIDGGKCYGNADTSCHSATIKNGGVCYGNNERGCLGAKVQDGGICVANKQGACGDLNSNAHTSYTGTGCCCGDYCGNAPKCEDKGISCDGI